MEIVRHVNTLHTLSFDRNWLSSGTVSTCHELFLRTVALFSRHPSFFKLFQANEGMEAVAKFYASRKKNVAPSESVAELIVILFNNVLFAFDQEGVFLEKAFGILQKTGLLGQFIRCVPVDAEFSDDIVTMLLKCLQVVKKKLKSGTPTGDMLDAVIGDCRERWGPSTKRPSQVSSGYRPWLDSPTITTILRGVRFSKSAAIATRRKHRMAQN
jgi:hypothetical protein